MAPTITLAKPAAGAVYTLGASINASFGCADETAGSGLASCVGTVANGIRINTSTVGTKTFTVTATDRAGNSTTKSVTYSVIYAFNGFLGSIANPPTLNSVKAGQGVALGFSLGGSFGLGVLAAGSPTIQAINCTTHATTGSSSAASGALAYSAGTARYTYSWQTSTASANTCQQLRIVLNDGTTHLAWFKLTK